MIIVNGIHLGEKAYRHSSSPVLLFPKAMFTPMAEHAVVTSLTVRDRTCWIYDVSFKASVSATRRAEYLRELTELGYTRARMCDIVWREEGSR